MRFFFLSVYIKNMKTVARVGYATPIWKRAQAQGLKVFQLKTRWDDDQ